MPARGDLRQSFISPSWRLWMLAVLPIAGLVLGGAGARAQGPRDADDGTVRVVVTTSMIGAAVSDLAGEWCRVDVLIPPAGCPGHFDIGPQALAALQGAALILRHDYQAYLEARLIDGQGSADRFVSLTTTGSQTLPEPYLDLCAQAARALGARFPERKASLDASLDSLRVRVLEGAKRVSAQSRPRLRGDASAGLGFSGRSGELGWGQGRRDLRAR